MLVVNDLSIAYDRKIFDKTCMECSNGDIVSIIGESGSGKTTFLKFIMDDVKAEKGTLKFNDCLIDDKNRQEFLFNNVSYIDQMGSFFQNMTIKEHFDFYGKLHNIQINKHFIMSILNIVHLDSININKSPSQLSTGERKRFLLAIAIFVEKNIIILDEPTASLDKENVCLLIDIIKKLSKKGITFIIATHDQQIANESHVVYKIENKKCIEIKRIKNQNCSIQNNKKMPPKKLFYSKYKSLKLRFIFFILVIIGGITFSFIAQNISTIVSLSDTQKQAIAYENHYLFLMKSLDPRYLLDTDNLLSKCADDADNLDIITDNEIEKIKGIEGIKEIKPAISVLKYKQSTPIKIYKNSTLLKEVPVKACMNNQLCYNREIIITGYYPEENINVDKKNGTYINDVLKQILDISSYQDINISFPAYYFSGMNYETNEEKPLLISNIVKNDVNISIDGNVETTTFNDGRFIDYGRIYMPINQLNELIKTYFSNSQESSDIDFSPRQYMIICEDGKDEDVKLAIEKMNDLYYAENRQLSNNAAQEHIAQQNQSSLLISIFSCVAISIGFVLLIVYYMSIRKTEIKLLLHEGIRKEIKFFYHCDDFIFTILWFTISVIYMKIQIYFMGEMKKYLSLTSYQIIWLITTGFCIIIIIFIKSFITNRIIERAEKND